MFDLYAQAVWEIKTFNLAEFVKQGEIEQNVADMMSNILNGWSWYYFTLGYFVKEQELMELLNRPIEKLVGE